MKTISYKRGIDISALQGRVDFSRVKASGIDFVLIRCGYGSDCASQDDPYFERNVAECEKHGIPWGTYLYSYAVNLEQAEDECRHILRLLKGKKPEYPICIGMEDADGYKERHDVSDQTCVDICERVCDSLEKAGWYAGIYSNLYWLTHKLNSSRLDRFDKWLTQWAAVPTYHKPFGLWQNSGSGDVAGVIGRVDTDIAYRDYPAIIKAAGLNGWGGEASASAELVPTLKAGDIVRVKAGAVGYDGKSVPDFVYRKTYVIDRVETDCALLDQKGIGRVFHTDDLIPVSEESPASPFRVGDVVKVKKGAASCEGEKLGALIRKGRYVIDRLEGDRVLLEEKGINTAIRTADLILTNDKAGKDFTWYTVKQGDSLRRIAKIKLGSGLLARRLGRYNGRRVRAPLFPGQLLKIPISRECRWVM